MSWLGKKASLYCHWWSHTAPGTSASGTGTRPTVSSRVSGDAGGGRICAARMVSWYFNELLLLGTGASSLLRVIQCHYYCIHIFYCQATIRNLQPMFCCIYFAHCVFTLPSMYCGKTWSNHILFMVKEVLY